MEQRSTDAASTLLQDAVSRFLDSMKVAELAEPLGPELAEALYVPLGVGESTLESLIASAVESGKSVFVSGTAGGGKTMLVQRVRAILEERGQGSAIWEAAGGHQGQVDVVLDLTPVEVGALDRLGERLREGRCLVAANEGPLMEHRAEIPEFATALRLLHEMKSGGAPTPDPLISVVDLASTDPVRRALDLLLGKSVLLDEARRRVSGDETCRNDTGNCPRLRALDLLEDSGIRRRVVDLVAWASSTEEITFRNLWDFVTDLLIGGDCRDTRAPTSAWFWRVFYGETVLAGVVRSAIAPWEVVMPGLSARAHYSDWSAILDRLGPHAIRVPSGDPSRNSIDWIRAQACVLGGIDRLLEDAERDELATPGAVVRALNAYVRYSTSGAAVRADYLDLWTELSLRRRGTRAKAMFSLGRFPAGSLAVVAAEVAVGLDDIAVTGKQRFLVPTTAITAEGRRPALALNARLREALRKGRAKRTADRSNDDVDWSLNAFYSALSELPGSTVRSSFETLHLDDVAGPTRLEWSLAESPGPTRQLLVRNPGAQA